MVVKDGKASTAVSFSEPGTYVVRAYADDGVVFEPADITVAVGR
jgi:plastocyanin